MSEYFHYYGKHRRRNTEVVQVPVLQSKTFPVRIKGELRERIEKRIRETGKDFSKLTRLLWQDYFDRFDKIAWKEECEILFTNKEVNNGPPNNYPSL